MNRRGFLALVGLAPAAAAVPFQPAPASFVGTLTEGSALLPAEIGGIETLQGELLAVIDSAGGIPDSAALTKMQDEIAAQIMRLGPALPFDFAHGDEFTDGAGI